MGDERGEVQVVFNGEIYNFAELRRDLQVLGCRFRSNSDTEVLVQGWRQWGEGLVHRLRGMFAFAVWDTRTRTLHLARDRVGKKPLFYTKVDIVSMASSLEARSPFLDHEVMELAARLPAEMKLRGRTGKWILKEAFPEMLPGDIATRPKMGFGVPVGHWFRGPLRELLLAPRSRTGRTSEADSGPQWCVTSSKHLEGRADHTAKLWNLVMLEHWQRELVDGPVLASGA